MKNLKLCVLPFTISLLLTACGDGGADKNFKLINPEDTSMLTANCKAYVDAMREQEKSLADPYKYDDLGGEQGINIDEGSKNDSERLYLDTGDPNGKNQTRNTIPNRSDRNVGIELKFEPKAGVEADEYKVLVSDNANFENAKEYVTNSNSVTTSNLRVNTQYYWKVVAGDKESKPATFTTGDYAAAHVRHSGLLGEYAHMVYFRDADLYAAALPAAFDIERQTVSTDIYAAISAVIRMALFHDGQP